MKKQFLLLSFLGSLFGVQAQNVNIPDANFKAYLTGNTTINSNGDGEIQVSEAAAYNNVLIVDNLNISDLTGIEAFTSITSLWCSNNQLTTLDVSSCAGLINLSCGSNSLTSLTLNTGLKYLFCDNNSLTSLDLSQVPLLEQLDCQSNSITTIDVSGCTGMTYFNAQNNQLTDLNLANGNNTNFTTMYAVGNSGLTCITVDNAFWSNMNWFHIDAQTAFSEDCSNGIVCTVLIPDANFKAYLVGNTAINTNGDGEIQCSEAAAFTGTIDCQNLGIADLSGIEAFTDLSILFCEDNQLSTLDLGYNTSLQRLFCDNNQLTSLNISGITTLADLGCSYNSLTSLSINTNTSMAWLNCEHNDISTLNLSNSNAYTYINCNNNQLTNLDVSNQSALEYLYCNNNALTSLDVSNRSSLLWLYCLNNQLTSLDLTNATALTTLNCLNNQLGSLDISTNSNLGNLDCTNNQISRLDLSNNTSLTQLTLGENQLDSLDVTLQTALTFLRCDANLLEWLNVANGNNTSLATFNALNNANLTCIQVDDATYSTANWTNIDSGASFSEDCAASVSGISEFEDSETIGVYPNPANDEITINSTKNKKFRIINLLGDVMMTQNLNVGVNKVDISGLRSGVYFVEVPNAQMVKLIKE